jgi:hypothetical protein
MRGVWIVVIVGALGTVVGCSSGPGAPPPEPASGAALNLAEALDAKKLRLVNRTITKIHPTAVRLSAANDPGLAWVEGTSFSYGVIEVEVRGRDVYQQSFVGLAFHRKDDKTYEAVFLRPFNFQTGDPTRKQHAVQYIQMPDRDFDRLRREAPEEFENPVDALVVPTDWVKLRVVVSGATVQIYVGTGAQPTLEVRKLGNLYGGEVGLWVGNGSDGDFANLVVTPTAAASLPPSAPQSALWQTRQALESPRGW